MVVVLHRAKPLPGCTVLTQEHRPGAQVQQHLHEAGQPKLRAKLELLLSHAAKGVGDNASATAEDVLVFVHSALAADARTEQAAKRRLGSSDDSAAPGMPSTAS